MSALEKRSVRVVAGLGVVALIAYAFVALGAKLHRAHQTGRLAIELRDELDTTTLELCSHLFGGEQVASVEGVTTGLESLAERAGGEESLGEPVMRALETVALEVRGHFETAPPASPARAPERPEVALLQRVRLARSELARRIVECERIVVSTGRRLLLATLGVVTLIVIGAALFFSRGWRRVIPRTRELSAAMKEMEKGRWPKKVEVRENDELGELAATFNAVAVERRRVEEELRQVHEELEERVTRRTEDLARTNETLGLEIGERRRVESALRKSEQYFRRIFEEGPLGMGVFDSEGRLVKVNATLAEMLQVAPEEMIGRSLSDYRPPDLPEGEAKELGRSMQSEVRVVRRDGLVRRLQTTTAPIHDDDEEQVYGLLMVEDITDRLRAEELLVESERYVATGRMAARIAHEINNPLAGIKNAFRLIKDAIPADHQHFAYVGRIDREIDRVAGIVRQMYGIYRPDVRGFHRFRAVAVIEDVVALIVAGGAAETPRIELDVEGADVTVNQLDGMLRQVLHNLLQNAIEASSAGDPVRLRGCAVGDSLVIEVSDLGEGIAEMNRGRIFEPFFTTKEGREDCGLGLGLAISLRAAEAMGGRLDVLSEPGVGSTFTLTIPLDAEYAQVVAPPPARSEPVTRPS